MEIHDICRKKNLVFVSEEGGYFFVRNERGDVYPVSGKTLVEWLKEEEEKADS